MAKKKQAPGHAAGESFRTLIPEARLHKRIKELAAEIRREFGDEPLHLVGVLKGAIFFLADLARELSGQVSFDFIAVSSYGKGTHSSGQVKLTKDLDVSIENRT